MKTDLLQHSSFSLHPFFSRFDQFADAPDAVAKMRELVRTLAANGRLFGETESRECPTVRMKDVCAQITDGEHATPHRISSGVPLATAKNVRDGFLDLTNTDYVAQTTAEKCWRRCKPQHDDILMVCVGATTGRVCLAQNPPDIVLVRSVALIRPKLERIAPAFLDLFLRSSSGQAQIWGNVKQSAQPCLYLGKMAEFEICLPPLAEQKRIVAKVDELMALCDRLEAQQQAREEQASKLARASLARFADAPTPANLPFLFHPSYAIRPADLRKSILTLAVQGKLVPQDPDDEPAEKDSECKSPFDIPSDWRWKPLGRLGLCRTGKTPPTGDPTNYGLGFPFIGPGQITLTGRFIASEKSITPQGLENSTEAKAGDILMVCIGGSIGKAAICREPIGFNQQINAVRLQQDLPEFVYLAVTADYFQDQVLANASGSATPIINKGKWEQIPIPLPPLAEQRRIVAKVEQLMALVDALETQLAASRTTAANLLSALVAELTGTPSNGKISVPSASVTGRRGRPPKS